jgi:hypothetical protein
MIKVTENLKDLRTARDLEEENILSRPAQSRERLAGRLDYYLIGNKCLYSPAHLEKYFEERNTAAKKAQVTN